MERRLRWLLLATIPAYSLWNVFMMTVGRVLPATEIAANIVLGLLIGVLATFLADNTSPRFHFRDALVNIIFFGMLALMFAAFTVRGQALPGFGGGSSEALNRVGVVCYVWRYTWRGLLSGAGVWLLVSVSVGFQRGGLPGVMLAVGGAMLGLLSAPFVANALFNGAIFLVIAVGVRLTLTLCVQWLTLWWQGFLFGVCAGLMMILLPFLGINGYGLL